MTTWGVARYIVAWGIGLWAGGCLLIHLADRWRRRYRRGPAPTWANAWLDNPLRRWWSPPDHTLAQADLAPGQQVLEIGPGPGYFTPHIARRIAPSGRVIALEINPVLLRRALSATEQAGLTLWVQGIQANALTSPLRDDSVDRALLITVLGEIPDPVTLFRELHRVLRPGGVVLVVEEWVDAGFSPSGRVLVWSAQAGFTLLRRDGRPWRYALLLGKEGGV